LHLKNVIQILYDRFPTMELSISGLEGINCSCKQLLSANAPLAHI